jgi:hypothetical protein
MASMRQEDIQNHPFWSLAISLIPLSLALYGTVTGTAVIKQSRVERAKNPIQYWFLLAFEYGLFVLFLIVAISNWGST